MEDVSLFSKYPFCFIERVEESGEHVLRIVVRPSVVSEETNNSTISGVDDVHVVTPGDALCEITFEKYVAYHVLNESYDSRYPGAAAEEWKDYSFFRVSDKTLLTDFIEKNTNAMPEWAGNYKHYRILGQMQIVNVITANEPVVKVLS